VIRPAGQSPAPVSGQPELFVDLEVVSLVNAVEIENEQFSHAASFGPGGADATSRP
jgi:hypothetical protein